MKIIHVSTYDLSGGAARAAYRLHQGLQRAGQDSSMLVAWKRSSDPAVSVFQRSTEALRRARRMLRRERIHSSLASYPGARSDLYGLFSLDRSEYADDWARAFPRGDVVHLHWVADFLDYEKFFSEVPPDLPLVWTLHDMNAFTGGCHYDFGCRRFTAACGLCPQLDSQDWEDLSHQAWRRKEKSLARLRSDQLQVVAPSRWLAEEAQRSSLLGRFPACVVPHGVDTELFSPRDRGVARQALGLPAEARVVLFIADSLKERRKGLPLLLQALSSMHHVRDLLLVSVGKDRVSLPTPVSHVPLGFLANDRFLSLAYSAADVFVAPALQEAFGQTALEALACGTPVVGFNVGGIGEVVRSGVNGFLVPARDVPLLAVAITRILEDPWLRKQMSANARQVVLQEYTQPLQAQRYLEIYANLRRNLQSTEEDHALSHS